MALVDEDSVDYVPITSKNTGSARKKAKLTEHQKEKFAEKKYLLFLENLKHFTVVHFFWKSLKIIWNSRTIIGEIVPFQKT